ncbi:MAG: hypothetical protein WAV68_03655 [Candidatus Nanogingivalis sp.]
MNNLLLSAIISFLAMFFGVAKDGKFGKVDATFLVVAVIGLLGWLFTIRGIGLEFVLKITPLDTMVLFNLILSGAMVIIPVIFAINSIRTSKASVLIMITVLSLVGYIFLPNFVASALVFIPESARNYTSPALFAIILFFVEFIASKNSSGGE